MKNFLKKVIPPFFLNWYHFGLAFFGAMFYGFPSKKLIIIGVTGTKGKTTACNLIYQIFNSAGLKTGMLTTVNFGNGDKEWLNATKQTMLGRFQLQKLLSQMVRGGCKYAVVETSSEGILQHRHRFIDYDIAVFTNLTPEHIERHGSFEKYREAKLKLFKKAASKKNGGGVYNLDDENVGFFLKCPMVKKYGYTLKPSASSFAGKENLDYILEIASIQLSSHGTRFEANSVSFETKLLGNFNIYNIAAAICVAISQGLELGKIKKTILGARPAPGRLEVIDTLKNFTVIVDYSYEAVSLENALKAVKIFNPNRIIVVFGSAGGGRDKWRRPVMGEVADKYADLIIVTTDDPYDEDPSVIIENILSGILKNPKRILNENVFNIVERREAIKKALSLAKENDLVLIAGKGGEVWMNVAKSKKIPWDDREIVKEELKKV